MDYIKDPYPGIAYQLFDNEYGVDYVIRESIEDMMKGQNDMAPYEIVQYWSRYLSTLSDEFFVIGPEYTKFLDLFMNHYTAQDGELGLFTDTRGEYMLKIADPKVKTAIFIHTNYRENITTLIIYNKDAKDLFVLTPILNSLNRDFYNKICEPIKFFLTDSRCGQEVDRQFVPVNTPQTGKKDASYIVLLWATQIINDRALRKSQIENSCQKITPYHVHNFKTSLRNQLLKAVDNRVITRDGFLKYCDFRQGKYYSTFRDFLRSLDEGSIASLTNNVRDHTNALLKFRQGGRVMNINDQIRQRLSINPKASKYNYGLGLRRIYKEDLNEDHYPVAPISTAAYQYYLHSKFL